MINENVLNTLKKIKNKEISIQEGSEILQKIKNNNSSEVLYYESKKNTVKQIVHKNIENEYIIVFTDDNEYINLIKELELDCSNSGNQILWVKSSNSFKQTYNNLEIDITSESDFEKLSDYVYSTYNNKKIHFIYFFKDSEPQSYTDMDRLIKSTAIPVFLIARNFAYRFKGSGVRLQIFSSECNARIALFQESISAIGRSIEKEIPSFKTQVIMINKDEISNSHEIIKKELFSILDTNFAYYVSNKRFVYNISETEGYFANSNKEFPEGVYVILGGLGAIGKSVAAEIAKMPNTKIILVGRRKISSEIDSFIGSIKSINNDITYISTDISNDDDINQMFNEVVRKFQRIDYVFHCAGILEDCKLPNKSVESFNRVISSKIYCAFSLLKLNEKYNFKKVLFFSSTSGIFGNEGQLDYAYANMLINDMCSKELTQNMISISWPFWDSEGMKMPKEYEEKIFEAYGFRPMPTKIGLDIIKQILVNSINSSIILYGDKAKLHNFVENEFSTKYIELEDSKIIKEANNEGKFTPENKNNEEILASVILWITQIISNVTGISTDSLLPKKPIQNMGIDSVMTTEINIEFEKVFDNISKTLLFEYKCIQEIAEYFVQNYNDKCRENFLSVSTVDEAVEIEEFIESKNIIKNEFQDEHNEKVDVAIIGIAGRYPKAEDLDEFWENLKNGMDCIEVIPRSRWDYMDYCDENSNEWWKSPEKWGGFIKGIDEFDSLVFNISPAEANIMDPHQRVYAQVVWHTFEDAGYSKKRLGNYKVGVYTGAMWSNYQLYGIEDAYNGKMVGYDSSLASISNRISYIFDLHGPSMTLDTMCSSSLTAMRLAFQSIQNNDIEMAVVGAVNLTLHPYKYIQLKKGKFLAKDGRCRAFGEGGTGYVPGEGAGAVILKRLDKALDDKDKIYGIIKGISINHGGKAQGYSVPNPIEQAHVINEAFENAGIDQKTISYIEAHGTGTSLGDPIEIAGLRKAFEQSCNGEKFLSIGSVKSNIGHLEAAAGIASVTKVLLQMKNRMLVPSIHTEKLNPNINLDNTPFKIQRQLETWRGDKEGKIRAGISAFGAGGANAHVVLEEYYNSYDYKIKSKEENIFVLSAKDNKSLLRYVDLFKKFLIKTQQAPEEKGFNTRLAYTTQIGRNHMNMRLAIVFENTMQLINCLEDISLGNENKSSVFINNVSNDMLDAKIFSIDKNNNISSTSSKEIAKAWTDGYEVEWENIYSEKMPMVDLPLYPFSKIKHWAPLSESHIYNSIGNCRDIKGESNEINIDIYKKQWNDGDLIKQNIDFINSNVVLLIQEQHDALIEELKGNLDCHDITIGVINSNGIIQLENNENSVVCDMFSESGFDNFISKLNLNLECKTILLDISDLQRGSKEIYEIPHGKLNFYKYIMKETRQNGLSILHCTQGLNEGVTQNGVLIAGLMKNIGAEYNWIQSKSIDFTMDYNLPSIFSCLKDELSFDGNGEILYKAGRRKITGFEHLDINLVSKNSFKIKEDKSYIITGGTRGIGSQVALHLAKLGAKKLVLLGRTSMDTPEKIELLNNLEALGAKVMVYSEGLHNETSLSSFFDNVYQQFGETHILFHCAGRYSDENAAFIYKEKREIDDVLDPKVNGLLNILKSTKILRVENIVLFSSISSVCPWLCKGVSDYVMANNYLNNMSIYGKYLTKARILSIVWQSWSDVGFMALEPKASKENGLVPINNEEGMNILFSIIEDEQSGIVLPIKHNSNFDINKLSVLTKNKLESKQSKSLQSSNKQNSTQVLDEISNEIKKIISEVLLIDFEEIADDEAFENYGMDSIFLGEVIKKMDARFNTVIDPVLFFECNTVKKISIAISGDVNVTTLKNDSIVVKQCNKEESHKFAIIGMSCRFPDADNPLEFWNNLMEEKCSIKEIPKERFDMEPFYSPVPEKNKSVGKWAAMLKDIEYFDPGAFEISEAEAPTMDPLIRLQLESSVNALRNAGYDKSDVKGKNIGVFVGTRVGDFHSLIPKEQKSKITGLGQNFIAAYTSQYLDLKGPCMVIDTACSSSLVCLSEACKNIHFGECDQAIVSGVDVIICENTLLLLSDALSPTGICNAFDEKANGFVPGEGCGSVIIKKLDQAIEDGDNVLAIIESVAINNDGHTMGITTPNYNMQMDVIKRAIERSDVKPEDISYIEAHGTGTLIGDPIELKALTNVYKNYTDKKQYCAIGSVKTNIGHLLSAAGMASLVKVALCFQNKMLPKTLNCNKPNPRFNFEQSPFYPCRTPQKWGGVDGRRIAGINSFGFGGTNAHVILSEYTGNHEVLRQPLPPLALNKKYYWFNKKEPNHNTRINDNDGFDMFGFEKMY